MKKIDLKKILKHLYSASDKKAVLVDIPAMNYLMADGEGDPNTSLIFQRSTEALFGLSYALKFMIKKGEQQIDFGVMPLEGLWWADEMSTFCTNDKSNWKWTIMIMQPDFITPSLVQEAIVQLSKKKKHLSEFLLKIRFEPLIEGTSAQILHVGSFSEEGPIVAKLHQFIEQSEYHCRGLHHEIYLSDPRKSQPEKWKTIIRQPVAKN